jgi:hypothetical protein
MRYIVRRHHVLVDVEPALCYDIDGAVEVMLAVLEQGETVDIVQW